MLFCLNVVGQGDKPVTTTPATTAVMDDLENRIESFAEQFGEEESFDYSELLDDIVAYKYTKMNLNMPDYQQLMTVFGLTDYQIYHLQRYLRLYGALYSLYELHLIDGMDRETIDRLLPCVEIRPVEEHQKLSFKKVFKYGKHTIRMRYGQTLEAQQGYSAASEELLAKNPNARYLGKPQNYLLNYNFKYSRNIRFGITAQQDAGEPFFKGKNKQGFDFYSYHLFVRDIWQIKALALGDYQVSFGQGLAMNMNFASPKPDNGIAIFRNPSGLRPYGSANEYNYLRGIAATIDCKIVDVTLFYSYKKIDAKLDTSSHEDISIETLQLLGYHRTAGEMAQKNTAVQQIAGIHLDYSMHIARIGATLFYTHFDTPLNRNLSFYNMYEFNEQENINAAIDYRVLVGKTSFFGEVAMSKNAALATINGIVFHIVPRFSLSVLHRYYAHNYQSIYSNAFGESSRNANEQGFFAGCQIILPKKFILNASIDYFRFDWLKYRIDAPSDGYEGLIKLSFRLNRRFSAYFNIKYKSTAINYSTYYYNEITQKCRQSYRLHVVYTPFYQITLKSRLEIINYKAAQTSGFHQGYLLYQDIKWSLQRLPLTLSVRFALFDTYSYDERVYSYEEDVLYAFTVPVFYSKGSRIYLLGKVSINNHIDFWLKIAQTFYRNRGGLGSGLTYISGNTRTDINLQLLFTF
jgi:hypothetical protein